MLRATTEKRLQKFILLQQSFPANIIFLGDNRMSDEGFGWAPWSFVFRTNRDGAESRISLEASFGYASESGLHVTYSGFVFPPMDSYPVRGAPILFRDSSGQVVYEAGHYNCVRRLDSNQNPKQPFNCIIIEDWPILKSHARQRPTVLDDLDSVLDDIRDDLDTELPLDPILTGVLKDILNQRPKTTEAVVYNTSRAVLGWIYREVSAEIYVEVYGTLLISREVRVRSHQAVIEARLLRDQNWCVG
jgi:hypothetical protein